MLKKLRNRVSSAHLMAAMALFIVLGGTAFAAVAKNSVGTKQLKRNAVTTVKIKGNAVTGAKVNESTLGKVPSAASADNAATAGTAQSATTAQSAQTAGSATSAQTAQSADDAAELEGRDILQVRPLAEAVTDGSSQGLDDSAFEQVMTQTLSIPPGGADVLVSASVNLTNNGVGQHGAQCELRNDQGKFGQTYFVTLPDAFSTTLTISATAENLAGTGVGNPQDFGVFCQGSLNDNDIQAARGDLSVIRVPTATAG